MAWAALMVDCAGTAPSPVNMLLIAQLPAGEAHENVLQVRGAAPHQRAGGDRVIGQALAIGFLNDFNLIFYGAVFSIPLVMLMVRSSTARAATTG